jgi:basic amino acid/polyamine antiporter, APA family
VQAGWASVLIATGTYEYLIDYALFAIWLFYAITVAGLFVLRRKFPDLERPYRMWGYPVTPALFVLAAAWFVVNTAIERPWPSLTALGLIALGFPAYWYWARQRA